MATPPPRPGSTRHPVDEVLPVPKLAVYGFQHVLAFYAGAVIVPILLAGAIGLTTEQLIHLINADLFTCGIASIIQSVGFWKVGVRLPLLQGVTFTAVSPMIAIGAGQRRRHRGPALHLRRGDRRRAVHLLHRAVLRQADPVLPAGRHRHGDHHHRHRPAAGRGRWTPSAVPAPTLDPTSGKNLAYAMGTLAMIVIIQRVFTGLHGHRRRAASAWSSGRSWPGRSGDAHLRRGRDVAVVGVTTPFYFGCPKFAFAAIISMIVVMLITAVETTGDVFATGEIVEKRIGKDDIARALRADGLATFLGGILNSFPYTCFAENVGLVRLTRIKSRYVVAAAGVIMILLGLIPKAGAIVAGIPHPVLGGAALAMFATVAVVGIQTLARVDFHDHRNVVIVGTSLGLAMYVTAQPDVAKAVPDWAQIIFGSGITLGSLTRDPAQPDLPPRRQELRAGRGRHPGCRDPAGPGQRDDPRGVRRGPSPACSRARTGWSSGPTTSGRSPTPTTCGVAFQEALFAATTEEQEQLIGSYPDLGAQSVATGEEGEESLADQSALGLNRLADKDHEELASLTAGLPRPVRLPADHGRARPGVVRPDPAPGLGAAEQLADPGARRRADRDRQDRHPPVRPAGGRREPDPLGTALPHLDA